MFRELHETLMRDYDIFSADQFYSLGIDEAMNMLYASRVRRVDTLFNISYAAWQNQSAKATKTVGTGKNQKVEPYFKTFNEFFNYEERLNDARGINTPPTRDVPVTQRIDDKTAQLIMNANSTAHRK